MAEFGVSGSVMLCRDFELRVYVDPKAQGYFGSVLSVVLSCCVGIWIRESALIQRPKGTLAAFGVSGSVMLCRDFDLRVCVDPKAQGYFGSVWCQWFCHVVSGF